MSMRVLVAPNSFKGSLSAVEAGAIIADWLKNERPFWEIDCCPLADGGDGTLDVLRFIDPGFEHYHHTVTGPVHGQSVSASYLVHHPRRHAVIEAAKIHGLALLENPDPMQATSYGVGQLLRHVTRHHPQLKAITVTVGGSASTDGGCGALQALGIRFQDASGHAFPIPLGGGDLDRVTAIDWTPAELPPLHIATDVGNPLLGHDGTAHVFAPQKGAQPAQCDQLAHNLSHASTLLTNASQKDMRAEPGSGAAGGLAYGLSLLPGAKIISGIGWISEQLDLGTRLHQCQLILTGEGRFDHTSMSGKATGELIRRANGKLVVVLCGSYDRSLMTLLTHNVLMAPFDEHVSLQAARHNPAHAMDTTLTHLLPKLDALLN